MKFNAYIWSLYVNSESGRDTIEASKPVLEFDWSESYKRSFLAKDVALMHSLGLDAYIRSEEGEYFVNLQQVYHHFFRNYLNSINNEDSLHAYFEYWIAKGITYLGFEFIPPNSYELWTQDIDLISNALYAVFPDWAFPYFFLRTNRFDFNDFQLICNEFGISLAELPKKRDSKGRVMYYLSICREIHLFGQFHKLSNEELVAFIYDFSINSIGFKDSLNEQLPMPSKAWYVGAGTLDFDFIDQADLNGVSYWQCNLDVRPGDIIVMYCLSPRSCIHSVWRAMKEGFIDVFFHYYRQTYISECQRVPLISYQEILANPILSKSPLVKKNFQGINGYPISYEEYQEMQRIWNQKGFDVLNLPQLQYFPGLDKDIILRDERDVEVQLIEPLLAKIGYKELDWMRQMPVRMGRGERNYPDYCFFPKSQKGEESALMILEAKWSIYSKRTLQDAFYQAKSYAIRLQTCLFVLAAKEGIWVFEPKNQVYLQDYHHFYSWNDLEHPDKLYELTSKVGPTRLHYNIKNKKQ